MRKFLLAAAGAAVLAGAAGLALAQNNDGDQRGGRHGFFQSDANNDGAVTRQEYDAGREAKFAQLDADTNGQLTREEMRAERGHHRGGRRGGSMHQLTRADANNDGNITRDEFLAGPTERFDRMDANDDGVISAAERPQRSTAEQRQQRREQREQRHAERPNPDANGDGSFSRAEYAAMGASMFERLDANDDGRVTQEETRSARGQRRAAE